MSIRLASSSMRAIVASVLLAVSAVAVSSPPASAQAIGTVALNRHGVPMAYVHTPRGPRWVDYHAYVAQLRGAIRERQAWQQRQASQQQQAREAARIYNNMRNGIINRALQPDCYNSLYGCR